MTDGRPKRDRGKRRGRYPRPPVTEQLEAAGIPAQYGGDCPRCPDPINPGDRVAFIRGRAIHVRCFGGNDE